MYKLLNIGGKDYKLEYSIEATLYAEATKIVAKSLFDTAIATASGEPINAIVSEWAEMPRNTIVLLYAGLLEHHGEEGDKTVNSLADAKALVKQIMAENVDNELSDFYGIFNMCMEQMSADNFFKQCGLEKQFEEMNRQLTQNAKKKSKKATEN